MDTTTLIAILTPIVGLLTAVAGILGILYACGKDICGCFGNILNFFGIWSWLRRICRGTEEVVDDAPFPYIVVPNAPDAPSSSRVVPNAPSCNAPSSGRGVWISAAELRIEHVEKPEYWIPTTHRGEAVAELVEVYWLDIMAHVKATNLNKDTRYDAFLVFELRDPKNLEKARASVAFGRQSNWTFVYLDKAEISRASGQIGSFPQRRIDGWMEIKLGEVLNDGLGPDDIRISCTEKDDYKRKSGLLVRGIELRPSNDP